MARGYSAAKPGGARSLLEGHTERQRKPPTPFASPCPTAQNAHHETGTPPDYATRFAFRVARRLGFAAPAFTSLENLSAALRCASALRCA